MAFEVADAEGATSLLTDADPVGLAELAPHRTRGLQLTLFEELVPEHGTAWTRTSRTHSQTTPDNPHQPL